MQIKFILIAIFSVVCVGGSARPQVVNCAKSDECIQLTRAQLACVAKRIERLLVRPTDPVLFDAAGCDDRAAITMGGVVPHITVPPPAEAPSAKWMQLSKAQLKCLRGILPSLQGGAEDPILIALSRLSCSLQ
jgi:hypothetical protein